MKTTMAHHRRISTLIHDEQVVLKYLSCEPIPTLSVLCHTLSRYCGRQVLRLYSASLLSVLPGLHAKVLWMEGTAIVLLTIFRSSSCPVVLVMSGQCKVHADERPKHKSKGKWFICYSK